MQKGHASTDLLLQSADVVEDILKGLLHSDSKGSPCAPKNLLRHPIKAADTASSSSLGKLEGFNKPSATDVPDPNMPLNPPAGVDAIGKSQSSLQVGLRLQ